MSLFDAIKRAAERDRLRLHTPGHKGEITPYDLTELTDDSFPAGEVVKAEAKAATLYNTKHARFLCCGSSQGVKAAILFAACDGVLDVNSHRSVFDGFYLSGKQAVCAGEKGRITPITVAEIERALTPSTKAVIVTTPTYYGYCADVEGISDFCKKKGLLFIADSAHGAHFGLNRHLPHSVADRCDICNLSAHKTLSSLTQSAILCDNLGGGEHGRLSAAVDICGTTSPSYLLYASIDSAIDFAASEASSRYDKLYDGIAQLKEGLPFLDNDDFTRPVLDCEKLGIPSEKLNDALIRRGVFSEKVDEKRIVFLFSARDSAEDAIQLKQALLQSVRELK